MARWKRSMGQVQTRRGVVGSRIHNDTHRAAASATPDTALPLFYIQAAFNGNVSSSDTGVTWTDITAKFKRVSWRRGRQREAERYDPGELSVLLDNRDRRFEPEFAAGPYYPGIVPLKRIRVMTHYGGLDHSQIVGYTDSWDQRFEICKQAECEMSATDGFKILSQVILPSPWEAALRQLSGLTHWWRLGEKVATMPGVDEVGSADLTYHVTFDTAVGFEPLLVGETDTSFEAAGNWAQVDSAVTTAPPMTWACWVRMGSLASINEFPTPIAQGTDAGLASVDDVYFSLEEAGDQFLWIPGSGSSTLATSSVIVEPGVIYFLAGTWDGTTNANGVKIQVNGTRDKYTASSSVGSFTSDHFRVGTGWTADDDTTFDGLVDEVVIFNRALSDAELDLLYAAGTESGFNTTPLTEIVNDIADYIGWPATLRNYLPNAGTDVPHYKWLTPKGQRALDLMQSLAETDRAALFMDRDGKLACVTHSELLSTARYAIPQVVFGNNAAGGEIPYSDIEFDYSDQTVINEVRIANDAFLTGATELTESTFIQRDAASVASYLPRTMSLETVISTDEDGTAVAAAMADRAAFELDQFSQPHLRITRLTVLTPHTNRAVLWPKILGIELLDRCTVKHTTPTGGIITQNLTIEGISYDYDCTDNDLSITFDMSGGGMGSHSYWLLGVAGYSELGVTTYLGF